MPQLEIPPNNVITLEKVVQYAERTGRRLADFYYSHVPLEVRGHLPHVVEHDYFLSFGINFADQRPWKSVTYHIPHTQQEEAEHALQLLGEKYASLSYYEQTIRRRWEVHHIFIGRQQDEEGIALLDAHMGENGVQKIKYFHGWPGR